MKTIKVGKLEVGNDKPFVLIAGLNVLEDDETIKDVIEECIRLTKKHDIPYIFKASYDKANRSSIDSYRGPGAKEGLKIFDASKEPVELPAPTKIWTSSMKIIVLLFFSSSVSYTHLTLPTNREV